MSNPGLTAQEVVLQELRSALASGVLMPGQQLVQEDLAEELGVVKNP